MGRNQYRKMSLEEHYEFSQEIKHFRDKLLRYMCGRFPKQHKVTKAEIKAHEGIDRLMCHLDSELFKQFHPLHEENEVKLYDIYYSGDEKLTPIRCKELQLKYGQRCSAPILKENNR